jgi:hypothetical protein
MPHVLQIFLRIIKPLQHVMLSMRHERDADWEPAHMNESGLSWRLADRLAAAQLQSRSD